MEVGGQAQPVGSDVWKQPIRERDFLIHPDRLSKRIINCLVLSATTCPQRQRQVNISTLCRCFSRPFLHTYSTTVAMFAATRSTMALGLRGT